MDLTSDKTVRKLDQRFQKERIPKGYVPKSAKKLTTKSLRDPELPMGWEDYKKLS